MTLQESKLRLVRAREQAGKTPYELAQFVDDSVSWYYDLERCDGELYDNISLGQLSALCHFIGIKARALFSDDDENILAVTPEKIINKVKEHLKVAKLSLEEFEDKVGYTVEASLLNPSEVMNWNVKQLHSVCEEIGVNWLSALP